MSCGTALPGMCMNEHCLALYASHTMTLCLSEDNITPGAADLEAAVDPVAPKVAPAVNDIKPALAIGAIQLYNWQLTTVLS